MCLYIYIYICVYIYIYIYIPVPVGVPVGAGHGGELRGPPKRQALFSFVEGISPYKGFPLLRDFLL